MAGESSLRLLLQGANINLNLKVLDSPVLPRAASGPSFFKYRSDLRRLSLKLAMKHDRLPTLLILRNVQCADRSRIAAGGFADVYRGEYEGGIVALKCLRIYSSMSSEQEQLTKKVCATQLDLCRIHIEGLSTVFLSRIPLVEEPRS